MMAGRTAHQVMMGGVPVTVRMITMLSQELSGLDNQHTIHASIILPKELAVVGVFSGQTQLL